MALHPQSSQEHSSTESTQTLQDTHLSSSIDVPEPMSPIERAISIQNHFEDNDENFTFGTPHYSIAIELWRPKELNIDDSEPILEQCLKLIASTSMVDYKASSIGWHPAEKKKEMQDTAMCYLLVRHAPLIDAPEVESNLPDSKKILGFLSFMYTNDDPPFEEREVVYIYEIHLAEPLRGYGLGKRLIKIAEEAARKMSISKTMLTVFSSNKEARKLYERLGYGKDDCSPADRKTRGRVIEADYIIMSKELK
jgi:ribosomal protein S18 acetylase RimI-like enzyme